MLNINILHIYIKDILYLYVSDSFSTIYLEIGSFIHVLHCHFLINQVTSYVWLCLCVAFWVMEKAFSEHHFFKERI